MEDKVKAELERMVTMGVIKSVTEPTSWVSSFVVVKKKGKDEIRLCIDPKYLNPYSTVALSFENNQGGGSTNSKCDVFLGSRCVKWFLADSAGL